MIIKDTTAALKNLITRYKATMQACIREAHHFRCPWLEFSYLIAENLLGVLWSIMERQQIR